MWSHYKPQHRTEGTMEKIGGGGRGRRDTHNISTQERMAVTSLKQYRDGHAKVDNERGD